MNAAIHSQMTDLEARYARKLTSALDNLAVPHDIEQRLRVSRDLAVARARAVKVVSAQRQRARGVSMVGGGQAALGGGSDRAPWWVGTAMAALLVLLVGGLFAIDARNEQAQIEAAAEVDAALLSDDLPPSAYTDSGFREFLRLPTPAQAPAEED
jgi:Protein of unknown function (DUF3619)